MRSWKKPLVRRSAGEILSSASNIALPRTIIPNVDNPGGGRCSDLATWDARLQNMRRVEEIEAAIEQLSPEEFRRVAQWFHDREQVEWDEQLDRDSASGKLDFLFDEADKEAERGLLREWPPAR